MRIPCIPLPAELLHALLDSLHGAARRLGAPCGCAEDYAAKLAFLAEVSAQVVTCDSEGVPELTAAVSSCVVRQASAG